MESTFDEIIMDPTSDKHTDEDLVSHFGFKYHHPDDGMVRVSKEEAPSASRLCHERPSSAGLLNQLPVEIIHMILDSLDFQSISRLSRASLRTHELVVAFPTLAVFIQHAPQALLAFGRTRTLAYHSANDLLSALSSNTCASCGQFGTYLCLLTCQRCCWQCLDINPALWALPPTTATKLFSLSTKQVATLPTIFTLPGFYRMAYNSDQRKRRYKLVSVRDAKRLALQIHVSEERIEELSARALHGLNWIKAEHLVYCRNASLTPLEQDPLLNRDSTPRNLYGGATSIIFPPLIAGQLHTGLWCRGCRWLSRSWPTLDPEEVRAFMPEKVRERTVYMHSLRRKARSRSDLIVHIRQCPGTRRIRGRHTFDARDEQFF